MDKKLTKVLKEANKKLREKKIFQNYSLVVDGDFTSEYNEVRLTFKGRVFPIANAETVGEALATINGYMAGLSHGENNSYPKMCDKDNY